MDSITREVPVNYTKEAFTHPVNLGVLLLATILGFLAYLIGIPPALALTLVCAVELLYLGVIPSLPRFRRALKLRKLNDLQAEKDDRQLFKSLNEKSKRQYLILRHLAELVEQNFEKLPYSSQGLLDNIRQKLEELLSQYLTLLDLYKRYKLYMNTSVEERLSREVEQEETKIDQGHSRRLKTTRLRRIRILKKRLKKFEIAREKYLICETNLETIEDAIRYIYEQSMTMNSAEEIGSQLDNLLEEMEETSSLIDELNQDTFHEQTIIDEQALDEELHEARQQHQDAKTQQVKEK
jgi:hypothetical protein